MTPFGIDSDELKKLIEEKDDNPGTFAAVKRHIDDAAQRLHGLEDALRAENASLKAENQELKERWAPANVIKMRDDFEGQIRSLKAKLEIAVGALKEIADNGASYSSGDILVSHPQYAAMQLKAMGNV